MRLKIFIQQLPYILPCKTCGANLINNIEQIDEALETKESFLTWLMKLRNDIYKEQNRPTKTLNDNINEIFSIKYTYTPEAYTIFITILSGIVLLILIFLFKKNH